MIIGELDLDLAQRDPAYLARVKAFLVYVAPAPRAGADSGGTKEPATAVFRANGKTTSKAVEFCYHRRE